MPASRRWTLLLVPDGCGTPRSVSMTDRQLRRLAAAVAAVTVLLALGAGIGADRLLAHTRGGSDSALAQQLATTRQRLRTIDDTLAVIARRDDHIRLLAGLPSQAAGANVTAGGAAAVHEVATADHADVDALIERADTLAASFAEVSGTLQKDADRLSRIPSIMPTVGWLSSTFSRSRFHPILHIRRPHDGIDLAAPMGAPIVAPAAGVVITVGWENGYGNVLEIDHGNGIMTKYAHCSRIVVRVGQHVKRGQHIANVGNTGLSTGPHLHYEIHVNGKVVNPLTYVLPDNAIPD